MSRHNMRWVLGGSEWISARQVLLGERWARDVRLRLAGGRIAEIAEDSVAQPGDLRVDTLLPALSNLHSHTFQRAMAGMTEQRAKGRESFWTWRDMMYRFVAHLAPEHVEAIAAQAFVEMQEAGFAAVGEFHYLHHQPGGARYGSINEMSQRIFAAAQQTGIGLTHLPVLYSYGGAAMAPFAGGQLRFGNSVDAFLRLLEACRSAVVAHNTDTVVGLAPHSLRATSPEDLRHVLPHSRGLPVHMHVAEQPQEVADIQAWLGARPVAWLLNTAPVDASWCFIHATHMTADETRGLANAGAVAGLCPITEANLGDGPFNGPLYVAESGAFGVGTDSNVRISLAEELRMLEYSQRLRDLSRTVLAPEQGSVGPFLYTQAAKGGAQALGRDAGVISEGRLADLMAIDSGHVSLCGLDDHQLLDGFCFAAPDGVVTDVWSAGRHMVKSGKHVARETVAKTYRAALTALVAQL